MTTSRSVIARFITVVMIAAMAGSVSGCALGSGDSATSREVGSESAFQHIHGLGVDPDDGDLFAATHTGVFEFAADARQEVATLEGPISGNGQDTMGFTMVEGIMFGSGHPDPAGADAELPALGLIVSTDQAKSWELVSLAGEADFHDIAAVRNASGGHDLYAHDGSAGAVRNDGSGDVVGVDLDGAVWVKTEGEAWRVTGAVTWPVDALTYSALPDPVLVVADARGVSSSSDLGANWETVLAASR